VSAKTHEALIHRFAGQASDVAPFAEALRDLAAEAKQRRLPGLLLHRSGDVLAVADESGQVKTWCPLDISVDAADDVELDYEGDGWFAAGGVLYYVHCARPYALLRRGRLAMTEVDALPGEAKPLAGDRLDAFAYAAAEAIEHYAASRRRE
jgi:hypothetical protein